MFFVARRISTSDLEAGGDIEDPAPFEGGVAMFVVFYLFIAAAWLQIVRLYA